MFSVLEGYITPDLHTKGIPMQREQLKNSFSKKLLQQSGGTIARGTWRGQNLFPGKLGKLEISQCWARVALGWGINNISNANWGHRGTCFLIFLSKVWCTCSRIDMQN